MNSAKDRNQGAGHHSILHGRNAFPHLLPVAEEELEEPKRDWQSPN